MIIDYIKTIAELFSPSGRPGEVIKNLKNILSSYADNIIENKNSIAFVKNGKDAKKRIVFSAHIDTVGFMASGFTDDGYIKLSQIGSPEIEKTHSNSIIFENKTPAILSVKKAEEENNELLADIGATDKESAEKMIRIGDCAIFSGKLTNISDSIYTLPYADNRIGVALLMNIFTEINDNENDIIAVFSDGEEIGSFNIKPLIETIKPDTVYIIDTTDAQSVSEDKSITKTGKGAAVKLKERRAVSDPKIVKKITDIAKQNSINIQYEVLNDGGSEMRSIQAMLSGIPSCGISIPVKYIHSGLELFDLNDLHDCEILLKKICEDKN